MIGWILVLAGCLDPTDCEVFNDCAGAYRPEGLLCGLAHEADVGEEQYGSSCHDALTDAWLDPAAHTPAAGPPVDARGGGRSCPADHVRLRVGDHEGTSNNWSTCADPGNASTVTRRLDDLPDGAACGLARLDLVGGAPCEGFSPNDGACPPGWVLDWVLDYYIDRVDETCESVGEGGTTFAAFHPVPFCRLSEGCTVETCDVERIPKGIVCGLHAHRSATNLLGLWVDEGTVDLGEELDRLYATCPELVLPHAEALRAADAAPTCMGERVSATECPAPLVPACTSDWIAESPTFGDNVPDDAWCWCAHPDAPQPPPSRVAAP